MPLERPLTDAATLKKATRKRSSCDEQKSHGGAMMASGDMSYVAWTQFSLSELHQLSELVQLCGTSAATKAINACRPIGKSHQESMLTRQTQSHHGAKMASGDTSD